MNNWYVIEFNETEYWQRFFLDQHGIEKVMTQYVFDADWRVHCCEITPSHELWFVQHRPIFRDGLNDEQIEAAEDAVRGNADQEAVEYHHCQYIDKVIEHGEYVVHLGEFESDEYLDMENDDDKDQAHTEQAEQAVEYCQANWQF